MASLSDGSSRQLSATSDTSSYDGGNIKAKRRKTASTDSISYWTRDKLGGFGIFYDSKTSNVSDIMQRLKNTEKARKVLRNFKLPSIMDELLSKTKEILKMSLDFETESYAAAEEEMEMCDLARNDISQLIDDTVHSHAKLKEKKTDELNQQVTSLRHNGVQDARELEMETLGQEEQQNLFFFWCGRVADFYRTYKRFLTNIVFYKTVKKTKEEYVQLFMDFSKIFFLDPILGDVERRSLKINGVDIRGINDVVFQLNPYACVPGLAVLRTLIVEPEREGSMAFDEDQVFDIREALSTRVLGQHGGELLLEYNYTAFAPGVLGMICMKTKIIFTYLEMEMKQYRSIETKGEAQNHRSTIIYTRPYDYLIKKDREEVLEHLFWLGILSFIDRGVPF